MVSYRMLNNPVIVYWDQIGPNWFRLMDSSEDYNVYGNVRQSGSAIHQYWECYFSRNGSTQQRPFTTAATRELAMAKVEAKHSLPVCYGPFRAGPNP